MLRCPEQTKHIQLAGVPLSELPNRLADYPNGWNEALPLAVFRSWTQVVSGLGIKMVS